jgi:hypothetical protein
MAWERSSTWSASVSTICSKRAKRRWWGVRGGGEAVLSRRTSSAKIRVSFTQRDELRRQPEYAQALLLQKGAIPFTDT